MLEIQKYIPDNIRVNHIRGHQDKKKRKEQLTMAEEMNIMADKIIGKNASNPKSIQIQNTPTAVYIQKTYISNNIRKIIRSHCGFQDAARFLKEKYRWSQQTLDNIEWELHAAIIQNQKYTRKKDNHQIHPSMVTIRIKDLWIEPRMPSLQRRRNPT